MRLFNVLMALVERISAGDQFLQVGPILIQWGFVQISTTPSGLNKYGAQYVTFQKTFSDAPAIAPSCDIFGGYESSIGISSLTATGFNLSILHNSPVNAANMRWIAIGKA